MLWLQVFAASLLMVMCMGIAGFVVVAIGSLFANLHPLVGVGTFLVAVCAVTATLITGLEALR